MGVPIWVWTNAVVFVGISGYLWWRLVAQTTTRGSVWWWVGTGFFGLLALAAPVALFGQFLPLPMGVQRVLGWPAWVGYGFLIFAGCLALLLEPVRIVAWFRRRRHARNDDRPEPVAGPDVLDGTDGSVSRRLALQRGAAVGVLAVATTLTTVGLANALGTPRVLRRQIAVRSLPAEAAGLRIALISDLHVGPLTTAADCRRVVDLVNAQQPDIVCLAGDFSDGDAATLGADLAPLADLRPTIGTYFVTGNHEFYFDVDSWLEFLPTLGVQVLANEAVTVRGVLLAGTHDIQGERTGRGPDVALALRDRSPGQPAILLTHNPVVLDDAIDHQVDLMLAGHTHGGQYYPGVWIVGATTRTLSGWYRFGDTQVFVTNGCRFWGQPMRLGAPMDVTVLELVPG